MPSKIAQPRKAKRVRGPSELKQTSAEFLSRIQIAKRLGCGPLTIKDYERAGRLTRFQFSPKIVRYPAAEVEALIQEAKGRGAQ